MSSFAYLKHLPVDLLKIDGSFAKDMATDPIDAAMVEAINHIGHVMGKQTIPEFVENGEVLSELQEGRGLCARLWHRKACSFWAEQPGIAGAQIGA